MSKVKSPHKKSEETILPGSNKPNWERGFAAFSGLAFLILLIVLAVAIRNPSEWQQFVFRCVLAIAAAAFGSTIPGLFEVNLSPNALLSIRATGAIAFFVVVYAVNPPKHFAADHTEQTKPSVELPNSTPTTTARNPATPLHLTEEKEPTDLIASGECDNYGNWVRVCSKEKPNGWTIHEQHFVVTGDRTCYGDGNKYNGAECPAPYELTQKRACYMVKTQGHSEDCKHAGNTGVHHSQGTLYVTWEHP